MLALFWRHCGRRLDDDASHEFMKHFYTQLEKDQSASKSLNLARKSMRESGNFSDVKHWAPVILVGDDASFHFGKTR